VATLMRHALKSATYKPALLKALVHCCQRTEELTIPLTSIGREFTRLYWSQTVVYHLRQAASLTKEASVVKLIRETANEYKTQSLSDLSPQVRERLDLKMSWLLTVNVLAAFHSSKPPRMPQLFHWEPGWAHVSMSAEARAFMVQQSQPLELIANFYWAEFLENCNRLAPKIVQKVSRDGARRKSLQPYLRILQADSPSSCFYCGVNLGLDRVNVDHVIPWSFLLEDELWDLVLACGRCNSLKSDWLPTRELLEKLLLRNRTTLKDRLASSITDDEVRRLYEAAISVEWPHFWSHENI